MRGISGKGREFKCLRCGRCCTDLLAEDKGVLRGMTLLPDERDLFPESVVSPAVGLGRGPHEGGFRIIAYQLTENTCPHLGENRCNIYAHRPASCRQYPLFLGRGTDGSELIGLDLNCPSLVALVEDDPRPRLKFEARPYAERLHNAEREAAKNPDKAWFFDLQHTKWEKYSDLSKE